MTSSNYSILSSEVSEYSDLATSKDWQYDMSLVGYKQKLLLGDDQKNKKYYPKRKQNKWI